MRRLKVLQLLPALESGGVERSTLEIAAALVSAGHEALVVSAGGRLVSALESAGARHVVLDTGRKSPATLLAARPLRTLIQRERPDLLHVRSRLPAWVARLALRGIPRGDRPRLVTTVHGLNSPSRYSRVMTTGERVICVSGTVRDYVLRHYPETDPAKLRVIPRGIDPAAFPRAPESDRAARDWAAGLFPELGGDGPLLLLPGRGTRLKGHVDALDLLASLRDSGLDARLWLPGSRQAGREDYLVELEREATGRRLEGAVVFSEATDRIARAYAASDLVLQLSRKPEAFGRTVVEALSVGRPVLGWDHGGVGELLRELQPAGAVPAFDADALARCARQLIDTPPSLPGSIPYSMEAMQSATLAVYAELAD